jgi:hypothetical protein
MRLLRRLGKRVKRCSSIGIIEGFIVELVEIFSLYSTAVNTPILAIGFCQGYPPTCR